MNHLLIGIAVGSMLTAGIMYSEPPKEDRSTYHELDNPYVVFDASNKFTNTSAVTWRTAKNSTAACQAQEAENNRIYGTDNVGFKNTQHIYGCAFFLENKCLVITGEETTMHTFGHEVRHCFQGHWH